MIKKLAPSQTEKVKTEFWSLSLNKISRIFFYLLILFLPTQLGKHFWPESSFIYGLRVDYLSPTLYLTDILVLLVFIFNFPQFVNTLKKIPKKYLFGFLFFILSIALGLINAKNFPAGLYGMAKVLEFSFLTFYIIENFKVFNKIIILFFLCVSIVFESVLAFLQYLNQGSIGGLFYFFGERTFNAETPGIANASINGQLFLRSYATFPHPNVLAGFLILAMLFLFVFSAKNKTATMLLLLGVVFGSAALILTLSRVAIALWIFYFFASFGFSMAVKYKKRNHDLRFFIPGLLFLIFALFFLVFQNTPLVQRFLSTKIYDESVVERQELISQSSAMFFKSPILGIGINNFLNNLSFITFQQNSLLLQPVHNIFLLTLSETGIVGLMYFIFVFLKSIKQTLMNKKENRYLLMAILAIIFLGMFDHYFLTLQQGQLLLSLALGISLAKP